MDSKRTKLVQDIKDQLIQLHHIVYCDECNAEALFTEYRIITDKNTIVLTINIFKEESVLFDSISILDDDGYTLMQFLLNGNHTSSDILKILALHFK